MRARIVVVLLVAAALAAWVWTRRRAPEPAPSEAPAVEEPAVERPAVAGARPDAAPRAAREVVVELLGAPAEAYVSAPETVEDAERARLVASLPGPESATWDRDLARAAREAAFFWATTGQLPPGLVLARILHAAGAPDFGASRFFTRTGSDSVDALRATLERALAAPPSGDGPLRVGAGEVSSSNGSLDERAVCVLAVRRGYAIDLASRKVNVGEPWRLRGRLPTGWKSIEVSALYPDGRIAAIPSLVAGSLFDVVVPSGARAGDLLVSVDGVSAQGPAKLLQLSVVVGEELPRRFAVAQPEEDPPLADPAAAEAHALALVNADRAASGLPALLLDPALSRVARAHSEDMRDHKTFGHWSPRTGLAGDRLRAARYRASAHGENVARNESLVEAEAWLMTSVGHRRNLLETRWTHAGLGLARAADPSGWYLTQLFARPPREIAPAEAAALVRDRLRAARTASGAAPLSTVAGLDEVARAHAEKLASAPERDSLADEVLRAATPFARERLAVWVGLVADLDGLDGWAAPDVVLDRTMEQVGVGAMQSEVDEGGRVAVVIVLAR